MKGDDAQRSVGRGGNGKHLIAKNKKYKSNTKGKNSDGRFREKKAKVTDSASAAKWRKKRRKKDAPKNPGATLIIMSSS
ncbi:hypothetical protein CR164_11795 [Prosthecochloris marina]|uniref:Uncharacterized protein n=1 Tax=Prosthecochloris marina TaxID=2017681 RepID=A0A317T3N2_9CHLB|nr:hypothetical protein [Prosthecochloris marina]PWW81215.1 hypothetical protein CR164_11795 [Prosthecochloris marina]